MTNWEKYFIISGCTKFVMPGIGEIDASKQHISEEKLLRAYQRKCPYVGLTPEGIKKYDPEKKPIEVKKITSSSENVKKKTDEKPKQKRVYKSKKEKPE